MENTTNQRYRDACDQCHTRKIKCVSDQKGACLACRNNSWKCIFSPRDEMGRPRRMPRPKPTQVREFTKVAKDAGRNEPSKQEKPGSSKHSSPRRPPNTKPVNTTSTSAADDDVELLDLQNSSDSTANSAISCPSSPSVKEQGPADVHESFLVHNPNARSNPHVADMMHKTNHALKRSPTDVPMSTSNMPPPPKKHVNNFEAFIPQVSTSPALHDSALETETALKARLNIYHQPYELVSALMRMSSGSTADLDIFFQAVSGICDYLQQGPAVLKEAAIDLKRRKCIVNATVLPVLIEVGRTFWPKAVSMAKSRSGNPLTENTTKSVQHLGQSQPWPVYTEPDAYTGIYYDFQTMVDANTQLMMLDFQLARLQQLLDSTEIQELGAHFISETNQRRQDLDNLRLSVQ